MIEHSIIELPKFTFILGSDFLGQFELARMIAEEYTAIHWLHQPVYEAVCHLAMGGVYNLENIDLPADLDKPFPPLPRTTLRQVCDRMCFSLERLSDSGDGVDRSVLAKMALHARKRDGMDITFKNDIYSDVSQLAELKVFLKEFPTENKLVLVPTKHAFWSNELGKIKDELKLSQTSIIYLNGLVAHQWFESFKYNMQPPRTVA